MLKNSTFALFALTIFSFFAVSDTLAQTGNKDALAEAVNGLRLRGIGPAVMGGRIADIAVSPGEPSTWYVAVGSGGLWKTTNSGTTWQPVFDDQPSYSIGTVTIDPNNSQSVWVGTGEKRKNSQGK